jgi:hypothetical protein
MPQIDLEALRTEEVLRGVLGLIGWVPNFRERDADRGNCPLHKSGNRKSRSFDVHNEWWYCHSCKVGGDALELYQRWRGLDTVPAALELCKRLGRAVPRKG